MKPTNLNIQYYLASPNSRKGFTLLELMVSTVVAGAVILASMGAINDQRRSYLSDRNRSNTNDNLRFATTLIGDDIKQAGENLSQQTELPVISVVDNRPEPSSITIQRKLLSNALTLCQPVSPSTGATIDVAASQDTPPCASSTPRAITVAPNIQSWQDYRCNQDGTPSCSTPPADATCSQTGGTNNECMWAYLFDPVNKQGEFFIISAESEGNCTSNTGLCWKITRADGKPWKYSYNPKSASNVQKNLNTQPHLYVLEQKQYRLTLDTNTARIDDYVMDLSINGQPFQRITNLLADMQFRVRAGINTWSNTFNPTGIYGSDWQTVTGIELTLKGLNASSSTEQLSADKLTLTSQFYPRNVDSSKN